MLNYYIFKWYHGTTVYEPMSIDKAVFDLSNINLYTKFLGTIKNIYDDSLYSLKVCVNRTGNILYFEQTACEMTRIPQGKYSFDILSKSSCAPAIINKIVEGLVYIYPSYGVEFIRNRA